MMQTSTLVPDLTAVFDPETQPQAGIPCTAEPSELTLRNILSFSRNLEIKVSQLINHIELIKS